MAYLGAEPTLFWPDIVVIIELMDKNDEEDLCVCVCVCICKRWLRWCACRVDSTS